MKLPSSLLRGISLLILMQVLRVSAGTRFSSHVTVNTPARSYSYGVGNPLPYRQPVPYRETGRRSLRYRSPANEAKGGYPRLKPAIPFNYEDVHRSNGFRTTPYLHNNFKEVNIPILPPSPYKVDSPDPESLWPEGLFLPPIRSPMFGSTFERRIDSDESDPLDAFLLEGSEAIAAVRRADSHGLYYFHEIPHIQSLLTNQELRAKNQLKPLRIASIRHNWPYNRI